MKSVQSPLVKVPRKAPTSIAGFDEITGGGLPGGRTVLLRRAQDHMRQNEAAKQAAILNAMDAIVDAIYLVDRSSMTFIHVNDAACRMQNRTREELLALGPAGVLSISRAELGRTYDTIIASGVAAEPLEMLRRREDGSQVWVELRRHAHRSGEHWTIITLVRDITERKRADDALRESESSLREAQEIGRVGSYVLDIPGDVWRSSAMLDTIFGIGAEFPRTMVGWAQIVHPTEREQMASYLLDIIAAHRRFEKEYRIVRANDEAERWVLGLGVVEYGADGAALRMVGTIQDITERKAAEDRIAYLNRVHAMLSGINTLIVRVHDRDELFKEACRIAVEAGGFRMAWTGIVDRTMMKIVPIASAGVDEELLVAIKDSFALSEDTPLGDTIAARAIREKRVIVTNNLKTNPMVAFGFGKRYAESGVCSMAILPLIVSNEAVGVLALYARESEFFQEEELELLTGLVGDIAFAIDHIEKGEKLNYLAYYDVLTGLANRTLFLERVAQYMRSAVSGGHQLALFLIDLERFKNINDSLGRPTGDDLLRQVAQWLTHNAAEDVNLLARVDADHFAVVMPVVRQEGSLAQLIEKWMEAVQNHPFRLNDAVFRIAVKVGVALFPDDGADADTLFRNAEAALKKAKASGEHYLFYASKMTAAVASKLNLENQLRQALDKGEFVLHYQPKVNLASGKMTSAEALIRWNNPRSGLVPPGRFIPILEDTGLIYEAGRWALRKAIEDYLRWRSAGLAVVRIAVNVSPLQLRNRGFIDEIAQVIGVDANAAAGLELEITESLIMEDVKHNIASLQAIRAMGVTIAIDDFGTGFSSLSYLAKLPVDTLKIDRSFVIDMTGEPEGLALVSTIINLAHSLELKVVAEGVETEEQARLLRLLRCDEMQGYLFSQPVPGEIFETRFLKHHAKT